MSIYRHHTVLIGSGSVNGKCRLQIDHKSLSVSLKRQRVGVVNKEIIGSSSHLAKILFLLVGEKCSSCRDSWVINATAKWKQLFHSYTGRKSEKQKEGHVKYSKGRIHKIKPATTHNHAYLHFKVIVIEELLVHSVCIGVDRSQEHSNGQNHRHLLYIHQKVQ